MKNNTFTYLLYAVIGLLIVFAGYLAIEHKKEQTRKAEEMARDQEQLSRTLSQNGTIDTTSGNGSAYIGEKTTTPTGSTTVPTADKNGIEQDVPTSSTAAQPKAAPTATQPAPKSAAPAPTAPKPTALAPAPVTGSKTLAPKTGAGVAPKTVAPPAPSGRFHVVAGVFSQVANARSEMERMVKLGYRNAEVVKIKDGEWRVVVHRAKSRTEALEYKGDLERHGIDAQIKDTASK
jgi:cell division protein FtsN